MHTTKTNDGGPMWPEDLYRARVVESRAFEFMESQGVKWKHKRALVPATLGDLRVLASKSYLKIRLCDEMVYNQGPLGVYFYHRELVPEVIDMLDRALVLEDLRDV